MSADLREIVTVLDVMGIHATVEYPGYLDIVYQGQIFNAGTVNPQWGLDRVDRDGDHVDGMCLPVDSYSDDVTAIVAALITGMMMIAAKYRQPVTQS